LSSGCFSSVDQLIYCWHRVEVCRGNVWLGCHHELFSPFLFCSFGLLLYRQLYLAGLLYILEDLLTELNHALRKLPTDVDEVFDEAMSK